MGRVQVLRSSGEPAAGAELNADATLNGKKTVAVPSSADAQGWGEVRMQIPADLADNLRLMNVRVKDRDQEKVITQAVPPRTFVPHVTFFPEGGSLVAGVPNRVYFTCRNSEGSPTELSGRVVDRQGKEITTAQTLNEARGLLEFTPQAGEIYTLEVQNLGEDRPVRRTCPRSPINRAGPCSWNSRFSNMQTRWTLKYAWAAPMQTCWSPPIVAACSSASSASTAHDTYRATKAMGVGCNFPFPRTHRGRFVWWSSTTSRVLPKPFLNDLCFANRAANCD